MKKAIIHQHYPLDYAGEEALNSICTNLAFIGTDKRKIVITSNSQSEGKSWMTMHIAENMARRGRHVCWWTRICAAPSWCSAISWNWKAKGWAWRIFSLDSAT